MNSYRGRCPNRTKSWIHRRNNTFWKYRKLNPVSCIVKSIVCHFNNHTRCYHRRCLTFYTITWYPSASNCTVIAKTTIQRIRINKITTIHTYNSTTFSWTTTWNNVWYCRRCIITVLYHIFTIINTICRNFHRYCTNLIHRGYTTHIRWWYVNTMHSWERTKTTIQIRRVFETSTRYINYCTTICWSRSWQNIMYMMCINILITCTSFTIIYTITTNTNINRSLCCIWCTTNNHRIVYKHCCHRKQSKTTIQTTWKYKSRSMNSYRGRCPNRTKSWFHGSNGDFIDKFIFNQTIGVVHIIICHFDSNRTWLKWWCYTLYMIWSHPMRANKTCKSDRRIINRITPGRRLAASFTFTIFFSYISALRVRSVSLPLP